MHQEHNIPWNALALNFKFIRDNPRYTPRATGIFARALPIQAATLNHFTRVLHTTITTFSATERQKYPASFPAPPSGFLFSDELRDRHPEFLNERNQSIEFWISSAQNGRTLGKLGYSTRNAELADVVKVLVSENEMETLLMLARHPQIPLGALKNLSWGHHFGFSRISESALHAYVEINLWAAMGLLEGGEYLELESYRRMLWNSTNSGDYPGHEVPHRAYLNALPPDETIAPPLSLPLLHHDLAGLKEYLKTNFALLYRYDMLMKECGLDAYWEGNITMLFGSSEMGTRAKWVWLDDICYGKCDTVRFI
ncbi:hypothetical protein DXG01_009383 [Tephrocybe rancida]|nr:hypothetical protein DXG01_009383 [Tephrocybe rancida]